MLQMYVIFKNGSTIFLTDDVTFENKSHFYNWQDCQQKLVREWLGSNLKEEYFIYHKNLDQLWTEFKSHFVVIQAAGGVVKNELDQVLFIYRNDKWDLPKGKVEIDESFEVAAIREVEEECGIQEIQLSSFIATTYHIYEFKGDVVLKESFWYEMNVENSKDQILIPQLEEGITKVIWIDENKIDDVLSNSYPNIKLLLKRLR